MDLLRVLGRKRQHLEEAEARVAVLREEVATLERAMEIASHEEAVPEVVTSSASPSAAAEPPQPEATRKLIDALRDIIADLPEPVSTTAVRERLRQEEPVLFETTHYSSLSGTMRRMMKSGELVLVEKGGPGKEATYRRPKPGEKGMENALGVDGAGAYPAM
jgi:hypothetical protein